MRVKKWKRKEFYCLLHAMHLIPETKTAQHTTEFVLEFSTVSFQALMCWFVDLCLFYSSYTKVLSINDWFVSICQSPVFGFFLRSTGKTRHSMHGIINLLGRVKKMSSNGPFNSFRHKCLTKAEYSERSDVWAFGVTMWEVETLGESPT